MVALFRLAFATATPHGLTSPRIANSQAHSSKGTLSPLLRRLQRFVSRRFQVLFHSPPGVLFTFPSRYLSAIGHLGVFRLTRWSWQIHTGFLGPRATWDTLHVSTRISTTGLPPTLAGHSRPFVYTLLSRRPFGRRVRRVPQPRACNACRLSHTPGLASSGFARHYSRNHCCFLFLWVLRCFTSPRSLYPPYIFRRESPGVDPGGVSPFGHPRIKARLSAPRGLSQIATSFFGSRCQGIHRLLLKT